MLDKITQSNIFGEIKAPEHLSKIGTIEGGALGLVLNLFIKIVIIGAAVYALINLLVAGYAFMSAGDDPQKMAGAWQKIWVTLLGLALTAGAFVLAAIFGQLLFGKWEFLLQPEIPIL